jgi:two-component system NtrC family sensor kinase
MEKTKERILLVESDPEIWDLISNQALEPLGYQVHVVEDVNHAILFAARFSPDVVIADLNLPGLNGRDLKVAFNSQGLLTPFIVIANRGEENKVIQAFRLGATDYFLWPVGEAQVVTVVERALAQVREHRDRERLDLQIKETNKELQHRVHELTTVFAIGKAVSSVTDLKILFDKIVEGMVSAAQADFGWLLIRDEHSHAFVLSSHRNLPGSWAAKLDSLADDSLSSLVTISGETLAINGEPLERYKLSSLGKSVVLVPLKVQLEVVGVLIIVRKEDRPFDRNTQFLLEALADYASISLVNARLVRALQETAEVARKGERRMIEQLRSLRKTVTATLDPAAHPLNQLLEGKIEGVSTEQEQLLLPVREALQHALKLLSSSGKNAEKHDSR